MHNRYTKWSLLAESDDHPWGVALFGLNFRSTKFLFDVGHVVADEATILGIYQRFVDECFREWDLRQRVCRIAKPPIESNHGIIAIIKVNSNCLFVYGALAFRTIIVGPFFLAYFVQPLVQIQFHGGYLFDLFYPLLWGEVERRSYKVNAHVTHGSCAIYVVLIAIPAAAS